MKPRHSIVAIVMVSSAATAWAQAQDVPTSVLPGAAEAGQCAQAQPVIDKLLDAANERLETARQTNSAAAMRAALDDLQGVIRDVRMQLAPCAKLGASADPHAGHAMPGMTGGAPKPPGTPMPAPSAAKPAAKPPASMPPGHDMSTMKPAAPTAKPSSPATKPAAKPPAGMPPGHDMSAMKPSAPAPSRPSTKKPAAPGSKPAAGGMPPGHDMPAMTPASKPPAPTSKPAAPAAKPPADAQAGHDMSAMKPASPAPNQAVDPICGLKVDKDTAPKASVGGQTYYFCSEKHQELFQKNPSKYLPKRR